MIGVTRLDEQRKFTDNLTLIEIDIENAIMENNLDVARQELAKLVEKAPAHPRRGAYQAPPPTWRDRTPAAVPL